MRKIQLFIVFLLATSCLSGCDSQPVVKIDPINYAQYQNQATVSFGAAYNLVVDKNSNVYTYGQRTLGYNAEHSTATPELIISDVKQAIALGDNGMALKKDNSLWVWGDNSKHGQCGFDVSVLENAKIAVPKKLIEDVCFIAANAKLDQDMASGLAIKNDGSLWGWGEIAGKSPGKIGQKTPDITMPIKIDTNVKMVYGSEYIQPSTTGIYYYIKTDNSLWACGSNYFGMIGKGSVNDTYFTPVKVLEDVADVSVSGFHVLALKTDGSVWAWGSNEYGQIGTGKIGDRNLTTYQDALQLTPNKVMDGAVKIKTSSYSCFAIKQDGSLWGWGSNDYCEMGHADAENMTTPSQTNIKYIQEKPIKIMKNVKDVFAERVTIFALDNNNTLYTWGSSSAGNGGVGVSAAKGFGTSAFVKTPTKVMEDVKSVNLFVVESGIIKNDNSIWLCGLDPFFKRINGETVYVNTPQQFILPEGE